MTASDMRIIQSLRKSLFLSLLPANAYSPAWSDASRATLISRRFVMRYPRVSCKSFVCFLRLTTPLFTRIGFYDCRKFRMTRACFFDLTATSRSCLRCRDFDFFRRKCRAPCLRCMIFPVLVILNLFLTTFLVFCFGMAFLLPVRYDLCNERSAFHVRLPYDANGV